MQSPSAFIWYSASPWLWIGMDRYEHRQDNDFSFKTFSFKAVLCFLWMQTQKSQPAVTIGLTRLHWLGSDLIFTVWAHFCLFSSLVHFLQAPEIPARCSTQGSGRLNCQHGGQLPAAAQGPGCPPAPGPALSWVQKMPHTTASSTQRAVCLFKTARALVENASMLLIMLPLLKFTRVAGENMRHFYKQTLAHCLT